MTNCCLFCICGRSACVCVFVCVLSLSTLACYHTTPPPPGILTHSHTNWGRLQRVAWLWAPSSLCFMRPAFFPASSNPHSLLMAQMWLRHMEMLAAVAVAVGASLHGRQQPNAIISIFKHFGRRRRFHVICSRSMFAASRASNAAC